MTDTAPGTCLICGEPEDSADFEWTCPVCSVPDDEEDDDEVDEFEERNCLLVQRLWAKRVVDKDAMFAAMDVVDWSTVQYRHGEPEQWRGTDGNPLARHHFEALEMCTPRDVEEYANLRRAGYEQARAWLAANDPRQTRMELP